MLRWLRRFVAVRRAGFPVKAVVGEYGRQQTPSECTIRCGRCGAPLTVEVIPAKADAALHAALAGHTLAFHSGPRRFTFPLVQPPAPLLSAAERSAVLPAFNPVRRCPKCGGLAACLFHDAPSICMPPGAVIPPTMGRPTYAIEHMHRTCTVCAYMWVERLEPGDEAV